MNRWKKYLRIISLLIATMLLVNGQRARAREDNHTVTQPDGSQVVYTWDNTEIISIEFDYGSNMHIHGTHKTADADTIYRTIGFTVTKGKANKNVTSYTGRKGTILAGQGMILDDNVQGDDTYTTYTINRELLMDIVLGDLGYTSQELQQGITVYLSNIFQVGQRKNGNFIPRDSYQYKNYQNIASGRGIVDAAAWGERTRDLLRSYYDIAVNIKMTANNTYKVQYIDEKTDAVLKTAVNDTKIMMKEKYCHTPTADFTSAGKTYQYSSKYKVEYENGRELQNNSWPLSAGRIQVSHEYESNATLKIYYKEKEPSPYEVIVSFVDQYGTSIAKDVSLGIFKKGDKLSYIPTATITYRKKEYTYDKKWSYSYLKPSGDAVSESELTSPVRPYLKSLPDVKEGMKFYVTVHYNNDSIPKPSTTPTPTPTPTGAPPVTVTPVPKPDLPEVYIPLPAYEEEAMNENVTTAIIRPDIRGSERFNADTGVPTIESLYAQVTATEYMLGYTFEKKVGSIRYQIPVTKKYILQWDGKLLDDGTKEVVTEEVIVQQVCEVERGYGYWNIDYLDYFTIKNAVLNNYALPNETQTISPNATYYQMPVVGFYDYSMDEHIIPPSQVADGLVLEDTVLVGTTDKPLLPEEDLTYDAYIRTDMIKVKNDYLSFHGQVVLSDDIKEIEGSDIQIWNIQPCTTKTLDSALYRDTMIIEAKKLNGRYGSNGSIHYEGKARVNSKYGNTISYPIQGINDVVIHTPVYCEGIITADNDSYVQLINPDTRKVQLVLDEDHTLNDMIVSVNNAGTHSYKHGYYYRDFSKTIRLPSLSYIAWSNNILRNEVRFPFDVYMDVGNDKVTSNDTFVTSNTWIVIGRSAPRVYLPLWVEEGSYRVDFRSIAVNGEDRLKQTESTANTSLYNYVAIDTVEVEVSGRLYGLTLYDVTDYPIWKEVFRVEKSTELKRNSNALIGTNDLNYAKDKTYDYRVGVKDQYGKVTTRKAKYTVPMVNGSHPKYRNMGVLKTGYGIRYMVTAIGDYSNTAAYVKIKPSFYYVDKDGKNRVAVDLYYDEEINGVSRKLIKVGGEIDKSNIKNVRVGDPYLAIPSGELKTTADIWNQTLSEWTLERYGMYHFNEIKLRSPFRTFVNTEYANKVRNSPQASSISRAGISTNKMVKTRQNYYGEYYIPLNVKAVNRGYDVYQYASRYGITYKEDFWKKDGYLIVNFDLVTVDNKGNERLSYTNISNYLNYNHCNMWVLEGGLAKKTDSNGTEFTFSLGDFMMYYMDKDMSEDYGIGGTH